MAYFSNGTEGVRLDSQCSECLVPDDAPCPILLAQTHFNYDQCDIPKLRECLTVLVDENGICRMKSILDKLGMPADMEPIIQINLTKDEVKNFWKLK